MGKIGALQALIRQLTSNVVDDAKALNTFKMADRSSEYGRLTGYPQPAGTPVEKLFSNFADNNNSTPEQLRAFQEAMFNRANKRHGVTGEHLTDEMTQMPWGNSTYEIVTNPRFGRVGVRDVQGGLARAAASLENGYLDSIATHPDFSGQGIGYNLLKFIRDNNLGNVQEVADRSPGFVKMQKKLLGGE